jgi:xanthine dehydrogenase accessory factor
MALGPDLDAADAAAAVLEAMEGGHRVVVVLRPVTGPRGRGRRRLLTETGSGVRTTGTLGDPDLDAMADARAREIFDSALAPGRHGDLYYELHGPRSELVIVGAGHIARPLCTLGTLLDFRVTVADDRPDFATPERFPEAARVEVIDFSDPFRTIRLHAASHLVLVTRGHRYDYECLRRVLLADVEPRYLGMIGSRRRVRATLEALVREGVSRDRLARLRAPLGLDLGAQSPAEIAVSVAAELVLLARGGSGRPLRDLERVLERFLPETRTAPEGVGSGGESP